MFGLVFSKRYGAALLSSCLVLFCGCGNGEDLETAAVSGVVTIDGAPLNGGRILFTPEKGRGASGEIGSNGEFSLHTYGTNDGAILGNHGVAVVSGESAGFESDEQVKSQIPVKYFNAGTSGLTFEVKSSGENKAKFELSTK